MFCDLLSNLGRYEMCEIIHSARFESVLGYKNNITPMSEME